MSGDFKNSFTAELSTEFATLLILQLTPRLKYVALLPSQIHNINFKKQMSNVRLLIGMT